MLDLRAPDGWRRVAGLVLLTAILGIGAWSDSAAAPRIRTGNTDEDAQSAEDAKSAAKILAKLDAIEATQQRILGRLDEVMEELKIVKIRATVR